MRGELTSFKRVRTPEYDLGNLSPNFYIVNRGLDGTRRFENRYPKIVQTNLPIFFGGPEAPSVGPQPQLG